MFFEEKLEEIRTVINQINEEENILVWGTGRHTDELMKYTNLSLYHNLVFTSHDGMDDMYYGRMVISKSDLDFKRIDCIIISSCKFQDEIEQEIKNNGFSKKIIKFYGKEENGEFFRLPHRDNRDGFYMQGNYNTWEEAKRCAEGYDMPAILEKVCNSTLEVINGVAKYERDSAVFYETAYTYHLLTLVGVLCSQKEVVNVVDVGGALGSLYWQNKEILEAYKGKKIIWKVVEQSHYVQCGRKLIQDERISFWDGMKGVGVADLVIFSGVLPYIEDYRNMIEEAINLSPKYILIDRTFISDNNRIAVEYVGEKICRGSYPVRIFEETEILHLMRGYRLMVKFPSCIGSDFYVDGQRVKSQCMIYEAGEQT